MERTAMGPALRLTLAAGAIFALVAGETRLASAETADACYRATLEADDNKVISLCTKAIASKTLSKKNLANTYSNRGLGYLRSQQFDRAMSDLNESLRLNPESAFALDNRGDVHREQGRLDKALLDYNAAIRLDPTFSASYLNRALTFEKMGNLESARADFEAVLAMKSEREIDKWAKEMAKRHLERLKTEGKK
jgi:tetratricopeptide (TPR) repeat protein